MDPTELKTTLETILNKLNKKEFTWNIDGSANLFLQGINVEMNDLDITTNDEGISIFREALKDCIKEDKYSDKIKGHTIICDIDGNEVEINNYGDRKLNFDSKIKCINWQDLKVPILPLEFALQFYKLIGRDQKVKLIEEFQSNYPLTPSD